MASLALAKSVFNDASTESPEDSSPVNRRHERELEAWIKEIFVDTDSDVDADSPRTDLSPSQEPLSQRPRTRAYRKSSRSLADNNLFGEADSAAESSRDREMEEESSTQLTTRTHRRRHAAGRPSTRRQLMLAKPHWPWP